MRIPAPTAALTFGFLAAFFWGTHSVIVRYLASDLHGLTIATLRLYVAIVALFAMLKLLRIRIFIDLRDRNLIIASLSTAINYVFFHIGLEHTGAANAMMLENTAPLFVLLFMVIFAGTRIGKLEILATAIALAGVFLTIGGDLSVGGERLQGDLLEIIAGASWAGFMIASSRALMTTTDTGQRLNFLFGVFVCSAVLLTPSMFLHPITATAADIWWLLALGIFPTALAYYFWYEAAARISALSASLLFTLSVVFTFINAAVFLGDPLTLNAVLGACMILAAVLLTNAAERRRNRTADGD